MGLAVAVAIALSERSMEPPGSVTRCMAESGMTVGVMTDTESVLAAVRARRGEARRRIEAHEYALDRLHDDPRWSEPEQHMWLERAIEETQAQINDLREFDESAAETEGCLEQMARG